MKKEILTLATVFMVLTLASCSSKIIRLASTNLNVINRDIISLNSTTNTLILNNKKGDGLAIIEDLNFDNGVIELELKGENKPGKSFVGIAFNIQNDSTYEAVYFRPFNLKSDQKLQL